MAKYWASVSASYEFYTEEIEAISAEEAQDKAYDMVKELMTPCNAQLRPFGIHVAAVGRVEGQKEG